MSRLPTLYNVLARSAVTSLATAFPICTPAVGGAGVRGYGGTRLLSTAAIGSGTLSCIELFSCPRTSVPPYPRRSNMRICVFETVRLSASINQVRSDSVVSTAAVSVRLMSSWASERRAPFTRTVSLSRSMPFDASHNSWNCPLIRRSSMKPLVLIFACRNESSSMTTFFLNSGSRRTLTTSFLTSAIVSYLFPLSSFHFPPSSFSTRKSSMPRSSGNSKFT